MEIAHFISKFVILGIITFFISVIVTKSYSYWWMGLIVTILLMVPDLIKILREK